MPLGKIYFEEGNFEKARKYFESIASTQKEEKEYKYIISDIYYIARNLLVKIK